MRATQVLLYNYCEILLRSTRAEVYGRLPAVSALAPSPTPTPLFAAGTVVRLKTQEGPLMVVCESREGLCTCRYFWEGRFLTDSFGDDTLEAP
jgi:uncharacterized protein YodC (DUF2158 family)